MSERPLAITMGDSSGIGPEIIARAFMQAGVADTSIVIGDVAVMQRAVALTAVPLTVVAVDGLDKTCAAGTLRVLQTGSLNTLPVYGAVDASCGQAAFDCIIKAIDLAKSGQVAGMVTAPVNKAAFAAAGIKYPGHTEILADRGGAADFAMMLGNKEILVVLVTIHCSLRDAIERATHAAQVSAIRLADQGARALGIARPRIAVAGLNPHAGEEGMFGREEIEVIAPAIAALCAEGLDVSGPYAGDTVFMRARRGEFDVVVAQYHDQGLIPVKYMGLADGVNITLGLPFVRTSPDHGTAFDIAGQGIADPASLITAIDYARRLVKFRER